MQHLSGSPRNLRQMKFIKYVFAPNYEKYEGVRPINIYLLRTLYFLMFIGVGLETWSTLLNHRGSWGNSNVLMLCVWAAYPTLSVLGLINPLRWLPLVIFMIFYKTLWIFAVAYPLWKINALAGSPVEETAYIFIWAPVVALIVPWKYFFKNYVWKSKLK